MLDVEIAIIPLGTCSTSISDYIAESEKVLENYPDVNYNINGMATEIQGENIDKIFELAKEMHLAQISMGAQRVQTSIKIDDRRDKDASIDEKVSSVESKVNIP